MLNFTEAQINDKLLNMASLLDLNTGFKGLWWKKLESSEGWGAITTNITHYNLYSGSGSASYTVTLYYCDEVTIDYDNGTVMEVSNTKSSFSINMLSYKNANVMKGKYFLQTQSGISKTYLIYFPTDTEFKQDETTGTVYATKVIVKENPIKTKTLSDYVCSSDINAYPNGDFAEDGYYYELDKSVIQDSLYKWSKYNKDATYDEETRTNEAIYTGNNSNTGTYYYSDSYSIIGGKFVLTNPQIVTIGYSTYTNANKLIGKYYSYAETYGWIRYVPPNATYSRAYDGTNYSVSLSTYTHYSNIHFSKIGEVTSINENAYPNGGEQDGYYYDNREEINLGGVKIESGSYVGDDSVSKTLSFSFAPKLILVMGDYFSNATFGYEHVGVIIPSINVGKLSYSNSAYKLTVSSSNNGKTIVWSGENADRTLNYYPRTYAYIALG